MFFRFKPVTGIVCCLCMLGAGAVSGNSDRSASAFDAADRNNDGVVDEAEFGADIAHAFVTLDTDGDSRLSIRELGSEFSEEMIDEDANGDQHIDVTEAIRAKSRAFDAADTNNDKMLSVDEVRAYDRSIATGSGS